MANFRFAPRDVSSSARLVVSVEGVHGKDELLATLAHQLKFPDWFGWNWDALEDLLRDLSWLSEDTVVIHHERVPDLPVHEVRTYLAILGEAVGSQNHNRRPLLEVTFAPEIRSGLSAILGE